jgi:hypothetical protein
MKTNHQRGFVEKVTAYVGQGMNGNRRRDDPQVGMVCVNSEGDIIREIRFSRGFKWFAGKKTPLTDKTFGATANIHDTCCGKHGVARNLKGAKKFIKSRVRFHENAATQKLKDTSNDEFEW